MTLGERIQQLRKERRWTLSYLGAIAGISRTYLANLEHNKHDMSVRTLSALANAFNVTVQDLIAPVRFGVVLPTCDEPIPFEDAP